jgi:2-methylcitrate dehydratase PrpD
LNFANERRVVDYIYAARLADFPQPVVAQAKRCFADLLACSIAGIPSRTGCIARAFACAFGGAEDVSLFGGPRRVPLPLAVLANTTVCEALDADDGYNPVKGHPGAFLFPAILAFAESSDVTGSQALESLVIGYEIGMRAGRIVREASPTYHGSGSWGGLGTAAVAARLLPLDREQTRHALGTAEYHGTLAPIMRCVSYPRMVKDGVAWSAFAAVSGALMARGGFTSSPSLFALDEAAPWVGSLGSQYLIHDLYFKPYCCWRWVQPAVRAALAVVERNAIDWRSIESVHVETFAEACALSSKVPETSEEAQYGGPYPVAAALVHGDVGPQQVLEDYLADERVLALLPRIQFVFREEFQREFPARRLAEVLLRAGGESLASGVVAAHGDPTDPLSDAEMQAKFRRYAAPHDHLHDLVARLEILPDLKPIIDALRDA